MKKQKINFIAVNNILPNPNQPRSRFDDEALSALADSIRRFGMIQPITVKKREKVPWLNINGQFVTAPAYEIIAGERRFRAAKKLGMAEVPCIVLDCDKQSSVMLAFCENVFREDLSFFDIAAALQDMLVITKLTQAELAKKIGISQSAIANKLRLLKLEPDEREAVLLGKLTEKHVRAIIRIEEKAKRLEFIRKASELSWSTFVTEQRVNVYLTSPEARIRKVKFRGKKIGAMSDIGVFMNSINQAVTMVRNIGVDAETKRVEGDDKIEIIITLPKKAVSGMQKT